MKKKLAHITTLTKQDINACDILLPSDYKELFLKNSQGIGLNSETEDMLHRDDINIEKIINETHENIHLLSQNTKNAQIAIEAHDTESLKKIQSNIKLMEKKILSLQDEIYTDYLTKVKNRKWLNDSFLKANLASTNGVLVFIDLNDFKLINDNYGHLIGDQVLRYLASFLKKNISNGEVVRYAGDEFLVILNNVSATSTHELMLSFQKEINQRKFKSSQISELRFSFSFGISSFKKNDSFCDVIEEADKNMYKNKETK